MSRQSRNKGARYERGVAGHINERKGWTAARCQQRRAGNTEPDVKAAIEASYCCAMLVHLECKDRKGMPPVSIMAALEQAEDVPWPGWKIACIKVPRAPIGDSVVVMRLDAYLDLVEAAAMVERGDHRRGVMADEHTED